MTDITLAGEERRLLVDLLQREWAKCDDARPPYDALRALVRRQQAIEVILRKLGYLG